MVTVHGVNRFLRENDKPEDEGYLLAELDGKVYFKGWSVEGIEQPTLEELEPYEVAEREQKQRVQMVLNRYQARAALLDAGLLDDVQTLMDDPATDAHIRLQWEHKERIRRTHKATVDMAAALGWSDEQLDDLFRVGMKLEA